MLSILVGVQKDETFLKQMFDISAITPLVKQCSGSKKTSIGHFSLSEIEGIILYMTVVFLLLFGKGLFTENFLKNNMQLNYELALLRNVISRMLRWCLIIKTFLYLCKHPLYPCKNKLSYLFPPFCLHHIWQRNITGITCHSLVTMPNSGYFLFASL